MVFVSVVRGRTRILPALREHNNADSQISPAAGPQGPTAGDSGSCEVELSHICFRQQPATLQLACIYMETQQSPEQYLSAAVHVSFFSWCVCQTLRGSL